MHTKADAGFGNRHAKFTREEYIRMGELGCFLMKRVHLIDGELIEMPPMSNAHAMGLTRMFRALDRVFPDARYWVRFQMTLDLSPRGIPDPDLAVIAGGVATHPADKTMPTAALLVAEVSLTTLRDDQTYMMSLYAAAGITDYWVLNLVDGQLEVYRDATPDASQQFGSRYTTVTVHKPGESVAPLAAPHAPIPVADLLP